MIQQQVLIDIKFIIDETQFKLAQLEGTTEGISKVTEIGACEAVAAEKMCADWAAQGLTPRRSTITIRTPVWKIRCNAAPSRHQCRRKRCVTPSSG